MIKEKLKTIPKFENEDEERDFWAKADTSEYFDWSKMRHVKFPNLKLTDWKNKTFKKSNRK